MASKINKGEILAKFFDDGEYTALFADGAVSAACGYAAGQQAYAVYQNGEAVTVKDVEKNIKVLEMAAQTGCPVVTFYNSVGAKLAEGLDVLNAAAKLNATIAKVSGVVPQVAVVLGVCGGTSALSAANADVCIMAEGAELFFTAPFTAAAKGDKVANAGSAAAAAQAAINSQIEDDAGATAAYDPKSFAAHDEEQDEEDERVRRYAPKGRLFADDDDDDEGTQMYDTDELDDDLDADDDEDYAPRKKRGRYADDDEVSEDDEMAERIIHWAPPITAIVCALIIAVSLVYHFVLA